MVAATRIITEEDVISSATSKKKRGRPTVLSTQELLVGAQLRESYRQTVNSKYATTGGALVALAIGDEDFNTTFCTARGSFKYQGVLEQIGRYYLDEDFTEDDVDEVIRIALEEIGNGKKSKKIEKTLRFMRVTIKANRKR